ncbi:TnsA-like heteromeric transposase endonuclease subunit [Streptomyces viridochromogenes]|uniref:TnsA-like heteromeric transposase endonuclease subunit n=1 Tax=Streptomyces viridochromogenes TaxID=1938 RepID=UPI003F7DE281
MDFDPAVVGMASQPFWLHWHDGERERRHAPDFFVRRVDGSAVVVDVRADDWIAPQDAEAFELTRRACGEVGWRFERVGVPETVLLANVRWLSRYRHPRCRREPDATRLMEVFSQPGPLMARADAAGDRLATLPVLFHLLWKHELSAEQMDVELLGPRTVVRRAAGGAGRRARSVGFRRRRGSRSSLRRLLTRLVGGRGISWRCCTVYHRMLPTGRCRDRSSTLGSVSWPTVSGPRQPS